MFEAAESQEVLGMLSAVWLTYLAEESRALKQREHLSRRSRSGSWNTEFWNLGSIIVGQYLVVGCIVIHVGCETTLCGELHCLRR